MITEDVRLGSTETAFSQPNLPASQSESNSMAQNTGMPAGNDSGNTAATLLASLTSFLHDVLGAVHAWPSDVQQEARHIIAASTLKMLAECTLFTPMELALPALPPAARLHFQAQSTSRCISPYSLYNATIHLLKSFMCQRVLLWQ